MNFIVGIILLIVGISVLSGAGQRGRPADVQRGARGVGGVLSLIALVAGARDWRKASPGARLRYRRRMTKLTVLSAAAVTAAGGAAWLGMYLSGAQPPDLGFILR